MEKICKNCKYYKEPEDNYNIKSDRGECSCKKFEYIDNVNLPLNDQLEYWDGEHYAAGFYVGHNFGCIHWEPKKDEIENQEKLIRRFKMKELKFRVWDGINMIPLEYALDKEFIVIDENREKSYEMRTDYDDMEIIQNTGIKDIHEKEIYEGDIVLINDVTYIVKYYISWGSFVFERSNDKWDTIIGRELLRSEIIGNIFENPELLKDKLNQTSEDLKMEESISEKKKWLFITKVFNDKPEETNWIFEGTKEEAEKKFHNLVDITFSPFVTYNYYELIEGEK